MRTEGQPQLLRTLGPWDLTAISLNTIIGSGIFLLPATAAAAVGLWAPLAFLVAGLLSLLFAMSFAEAAGRFSSTGGPYLAAKAAFGGFVGFEVAWIFWLSRLAAVGAACNIFLSYFALFLPAVAAPLPRIAVITGLVLTVTLVNLRGARTGSTLTNIVTVAKLAPLVVLAIGGALAVTDAPPAVATPLIAGDFWRAVLLVAFAFGGFEVATVPGGESANPQRDVPRALFLSIAGAMLLYVVLQWVLFALYPDLATSTRPLADATTVLIGSSGAALIGAAALISTAGYVLGASLVVPRITFALAEQGHFPAVFARVHARYHSPWVAIAVHGIVTWVLAVSLNFFSLVLVNVLARLIVTGVTCGAVLRLRSTAPTAGSYRAPFGPLIPLAGIAGVAVLL
jgi:basic amino acid/polyamine antiporter, APA family